MLGHVNTLKRLYTDYNIEFPISCLETAIITEHYECVLFVAAHTDERLTDEFLIRIMMKQKIRDIRIAEWLVAYLVPNASALIK
jgi:hypothetical protein